MINSHLRNPVAWAYHLALFARRLPDTPDAERQYYGMSFPRSLIVRAGFYDPRLRVAEDTALYNHWHVSDLPARP